MENPDILILDEPMNALDNNCVKEMRSVLLKLKEQGKLELHIGPLRTLTGRGNERPWGEPMS